MKLKKTLLISAFALSATIGSFSSQAESKFYMETDPATFLMKGDSIHFKFSTDSLPHWRFGIGTYSLELPDLLVDLNSDNKNEGWEVDITRGVGFFSEYYFNEDLSGWMLGLQVSEQKMEVVSKELGKAAEFTNGLAMASFGYRYNIEGTNFYVLPWAGIGYAKTIEGKPGRLASTYDQDPWLSFMTFHIGYSF